MDLQTAPAQIGSVATSSPPFPPSVQLNDMISIRPSPPHDVNQVENTPEQRLAESVSLMLVTAESRSGELVPLRTKAEVTSKDDTSELLCNSSYLCAAADLPTVDVYVVEIPAKNASSFLGFLREHLPPAEIPVDLHHLRRLVKPDHLPIHLRLLSSLNVSGPTPKHGGRFNARSENARPNSWPVTSTVNRPPPGPSSRPNSRPNSKNGNQPKTLRLVVCAASLLTTSAVQAILALHPSFQPPQVPPVVRTVSVPRHAPTSAVQAEEWSTRFWPTVYKASNPFGPHPAIFAKAGAKIAAEAGEWLALAGYAGKESQQRGWGEGVGVVIVDNEAELVDSEAAEEMAGRSKPKYDSTTKGRVVAVAGDARWLAPYSRPATDEVGSSRCNGNPAGHAIMRAIALVASARRTLLFPQTSMYNTPPHLRSNNFSVSEPLTPLETHHHKLTCTGRSGLKPGGYLCLNLTLYISHEPCVMCSMALLHSRFGRVIIGQRMPVTGALCADRGPSDSTSPSSPGYGLWWRRDLNWRTLAWEWADTEDQDAKDESQCDVQDDIHV